MPRLTLHILRATIRSVVLKADARGDIDAGRFTLKTAKQQIGAYPSGGGCSVPLDADEDFQRKRSGWRSRC